MKIRNILNATTFEKSYEINNEPDQCIPDQSMTVREIMDRFTRGLPLDAGKVPIYEGEEYTPDILHMDLADREEYIQNVFASAKQIQNIETEQVEQVETTNEH